MEIRQAKILFYCQEGVTVYDCLSTRIDDFDLILNNKMKLAKNSGQGRSERLWVKLPANNLDDESFTILTICLPFYSGEDWWK